MICAVFTGGFMNERSFRAVRKPLAALTFISIFAFRIPGNAADAKPLYKDPKASVDQRVEDLLARMTPA